jgi:hypothetical protein
LSTITCPLNPASFRNLSKVLIPGTLLSSGGMAPVIMEATAAAIASIAENADEMNVQAGSVRLSAYEPCKPLETLSYWEIATCIRRWSVPLKNWTGNRLDLEPHFRHLIGKGGTP